MHHHSRMVAHESCCGTTTLATVRLTVWLQKTCGRCAFAWGVGGAVGGGATFSMPTHPRGACRATTFDSRILLMLNTIGCRAHRGLVLPRNASRVVFCLWWSRHRLCKFPHVYRLPPSASGSMWSTSTAGRLQPGCSQMGVVCIFCLRSSAIRASSCGCVLPSHAGRHEHLTRRGAGFPQRAQTRGGATGISECVCLSTLFSI